MQDNTQQNTGSKWWQQEAFSEQRLQGLAAPERTGKPSFDEEAGYKRAGEDAAILLAEELKRKDAHIAKLEAMLRQADAGLTEHERRPEAFLPLDVPERIAEPSETIAAPSNGAMVYDAPPVVQEAAAGSANRVGGAMVYDSPPVAPRSTPLRLADMKLEPSPIAQIVMQAAARRLAEPVPVFEPTLRMPAQAARQLGSPRSVRDNPARRRQITVVGALGLLAFAGVIGASQLRAPRGEPILITPPPTINRAAFAAAPVKVSKPDAASGMRATDFSNSSIEILPVAPAPLTPKHSARHIGSAHTAAVSTSSPDVETLRPSLHSVPIVQHPARAVHALPSRVHVVASTANLGKSVAPPIHAETSGVIVEADEERAGAAPAFHSDTAQPTDSAEATAPAHRAEALPDDTQDTYEDSRTSDYRARRRRGYRYSQPEPTETRRSAYKYGEGTNRRAGDDAEFSPRPAHRYNERTHERGDGWTDERPNR